MCHRIHWLQTFNSYKANQHNFKNTRLPKLELIDIRDNEVSVSDGHVIFTVNTSNTDQIFKNLFEEYLKAKQKQKYINKFRNASNKQDLRTLYKQMAFKFHPDKTKNNTSDIFTELKNTYEELM